MPKEFKLGNIVINSSSPSLIICEIGINHNGSLKIAKKWLMQQKKLEQRS